MKKKSESKKIDWEQRFYEVAKDYFIQFAERNTTLDEDSVQSIQAAENFIRNLKEYYQWKEPNK